MARETLEEVTIYDKKARSFIDPAKVIGRDYEGFYTVEEGVINLDNGRVIRLPSEQSVLRTQVVFDSEGKAWSEELRKIGGYKQKVAVSQLREWPKHEPER